MNVWFNQSSYSLGGSLVSSSNCLEPTQSFPNKAALRKSTKRFTFFLLAFYALKQQQACFLRHFNVKSVCHFFQSRIKNKLFRTPEGNVYNTVKLIPLILGLLTLKILCILSHRNPASNIWGSWKTDYQWSIWWSHIFEHQGIEGNRSRVNYHLHQARLD